MRIGPKLSTYPLRDWARRLGFKGDDPGDVSQLVQPVLDVERTGLVAPTRGAIAIGGGNQAAVAVEQSWFRLRSFDAGGITLSRAIVSTSLNDHISCYAAPVSAPPIALPAGTALPFVNIAPFTDPIRSQLSMGTIAGPVVPPAGSGGVFVANNSQWTDTDVWVPPGFEVVWLTLQVNRALALYVRLLAHAVPVQQP